MRHDRLEFTVSVRMVEMVNAITRNGRIWFSVPIKPEVCVAKMIPNPLSIQTKYHVITEIINNMQVLCIHSYTKGVHEP